MKERKSFLVGLCGRSGSGKGYVSRLFLKYGIPSIDTDLVYRNITSPADVPGRCMTELINRFGEEVCNFDNSLNRAYLRKVVFSGDSKALCDLNSITHKYILEETLEIAKKYASDGAEIVIIDAPLLFESCFNEICDYIVCVVSPEELLIKRILKRDGLTYEDALRRLGSQISSDELISRANSVIHNDDTDLVKSEVEKCVEEIKRALLAKHKNFPSSENKI